MKTLLLLIALIASILPACAAIETNGFLVFEVDRYAFGGGRHVGLVTKQKYKVPLTEEFLANFKHLPNQNSGGTGLCCNGGHEGTNTNDAEYEYTWWLEKTADNRWHIHMWGYGYEKIKEVVVQSRDPSVTQSLTINRLEDLDMSYQQSYVNEYEGVNVEFGAKYVSAKDIKAGGSIPTAPVRKADQTILYKGDDLRDNPIQLHCSFQEN